MWDPLEKTGGRFFHREAAKGTKEEGEERAVPFSANATDDFKLMMILFLRKYKQ
jgi:hypothetical protein